MRESSPSGAVTVLANEFGILKGSVTTIVEKWAAIISGRFRCFGIYLSPVECALFCRGLPAQWRSRYPKPTVLWDTTDLRLFRPSANEAQHIFHSEYYGGWVVKAGIGQSACSWIIPSHLTTPCSDSIFMTLSHIFLYQSGGGYVNITDKGIRSFTAAREFEQSVITPPFKYGPNQASPIENTCAQAIAFDRAQNERAVRYAMLFNMWKRTLQLSSNFATIDRIYRNTCCRANWVYKPLCNDVLQEWDRLYPNDDCFFHLLPLAIVPQHPPHLTCEQCK